MLKVSRGKGEILEGGLARVVEMEMEMGRKLVSGVLGEKEGKGKTKTKGGGTAKVD